jgi:hypothetical protein
LRRPNTPDSGGCEPSFSRLARRRIPSVLVRGLLEGRGHTKVVGEGRGRPGAVIMPTYGPGESPVWSGEVNYDDHWGTLYVTNRRLFFERRVGVTKRRGVLAAETPLKDITSMSVEKGPWNWVVLVIAAGNQSNRFLFRAESPEALIRRINGLIADQSTVPERQAGRT